MAPLRKPAALLAVAIVAMTATLAPVAAQTGYVTINGVLIHPLDAYALGIPDGDYWYDPVTGYYGYINGPAIGQVGTAAPASEPGYNINGPFGSSMSDGDCAFVLGVPVGNC